MIDSAETLKTTIFMVGDIGGNEIDAVTVSIISTQKNSFLFSLQSALLWLLIPNSLLLFHRVIGYGDTPVVVTKNLYNRLFTYLSYRSIH